jgi:hypothetical protein
MTHWYDLHTLGPYVLVPAEEYEKILSDLKGYETLQQTLGSNDRITGIAPKRLSDEELEEQSREITIELMKRGRLK